MPKPVKELEPSSQVSVPVNLVSFLSFAYTTNQKLCSDRIIFFPVITGTVTSLAPGPRGTLLVGISIIRAYKAGRLTITQVGETMSVRLMSQCKKCPLLRRGISILESDSHAPQIISILFYSKIRKIDLFGNYFLSDRCQLHYHGPS